MPTSIRARVFAMAAASALALAGCVKLVARAAGDAAGDLGPDDALDSDAPATETGNPDTVSPDGAPPACSDDAGAVPGPDAAFTSLCGGSHGVVAQVAVGTGYACARCSSGEVACWGDNTASTLGDGTVLTRSTASIVPGLVGHVDALAAGSDHVCALEGSTMQCWGSNTSHQFSSSLVGAVYASPTRVPLPPDAGVTAIATGAIQTCTLDVAGRVQCASNMASITGTSPAATRFETISAGADHVCGVDTTHTVYCWGGNSAGQLGDGTTTDHTIAAPATSLGGVVAVAAGDRFTCALTTSMQVQCWGSNSANQLGASASTHMTMLPITVLGTPANIVSIAAGASHACVLDGGGAVSCWGYNAHGELGRGTPSASEVSPAPVLGVSNATRIAAGAQNTCAVLASGGVACWGANIQGNLGDGRPLVRTTPAAVVDSCELAPVAAGTGYACATSTATGAVDCWGVNEMSQLGISAAAAESSHPLAATGGLSAAQLTVGAGHACVVDPDGGVWCWGVGSLGQLGQGMFRGSATPVHVEGLARITHIAAGGFHTCAATTSGDAGVWCWGDNRSGQLGIDPGAGVTTDVARPVAGLGAVGEIAGGGAFTCARTSNIVQCWGHNAFGELGDGTTVSRYTPAPVAGLSDAIAITGGATHACAIRLDGSVVCWGSDLSGELGDGGPPISAVSSPVAVLLAPGSSPDGGRAPLTGVRAISAGYLSTCAVRTAGDVYCWGDNASGQLGDGTFSARNYAQRVAGIVDADGVSMRSSSTCVHLRSGGLMCWGDDSYGELGTGSRVISASPVRVLRLP